MKKIFLTKLRASIKKQYPNYDKDKIDTIMYGLEGLYITITKCIIIFILAAILGIFKEVIILLLLFNVIRLFAFGMHAPTGWICLIMSSLIFVGGAYLCKILIMDPFILCSLYTVSIINMAIFAPADTVKRPLINNKKRIIYKILSVCICTSYFFISINIKNNLIINSLIISLIIENILISPITYKLFKLPYDNYKTYDLNTK